MGPDPIQSLVQEDQTLNVGDNVVAHWNRNGYYFHVRGTITGLTARRVLVKLVDTPANGPGYCRGDVIELPRITDYEHWSSGTCVRRTATGT